MEKQGTSTSYGSPAGYPTPPSYPPTPPPQYHQQPPVIYIPTAQVVEPEYRYARNRFQYAVTIFYMIATCLLILGYENQSLTPVDDSLYTAIAYLSSLHSLGWNFMMLKKKDLMFKGNLYWKCSGWLAFGLFNVYLHSLGLRYVYRSHTGPDVIQDPGFYMLWYIIGYFVLVKSWRPWRRVPVVGPVGNMYYTQPAFLAV